MKCTENGTNFVEVFLTSINLNSMQNTLLLLEVFVLEYGVKSLAPHIGELGGGPRAPPAEGAPMSTRTGTTL